MDMTAIGAALRRRRGVAIVVFLLVALLTAAAATLTSARYTTTATLFIQPAGAGVDGSTIGGVVFLMPALEELISAEPTRVEVSSRVSADVASADWTATGKADPGTGLLKIAVTSTDRSVPAAVASEYIPVVEAYAGSLTPAVDVSVIDPPGTATSDEVVRLIGILVAGLLLGVIASTSLALAVDRARDGRSIHRTDNAPDRA